MRKFQENESFDLNDASCLFKYLLDYVLASNNKINETLRRNQLLLGKYLLKTLRYL